MLTKGGRSNRERVIALFVAVVQVVVARAASPDPEQVIAGIDGRVEAYFRAESGKRLKRAKKNPPLSPGRGNYVRAYSYSMVGFAARCLYLDEMLDEANAALVENARHYLDHPLDINDRDSFHWHADVVMRLIEMYGPNGKAHPGRITAETEAIALKPIWEYVRKVSWLEKAETGKSQTWDIYLSENHHAMMFTVCWQFSRIAKGRPEYAELKYNDGAKAVDHFEAWNDYFIAYCLERARKGLCIEMMCDGYNSTLIKGFYNFHDFGDPVVRQSAAMLLDLYFAYWAEEQIDGVQGGGRSRVYFEKGLKHDPAHGMAPLAWLCFGIGEQPEVNGHDINAALSDYRPPAVVADIACDVEGRGRFEVRQRAQGLGVTGKPLKTAVTKVPTRMRTDGGGILRYSYCDPAFIMGTPMTEARPLQDWAAISSQNRWQGVVFSGEGAPRIVPIVRPKDNRVAMNAFWSVQRKGTLITQKLKGHKGGEEMIVWISKAGLGKPVEKDGIVFVEAEGAYAAIRVAKGGFRWAEDMFEGNRSVPENATMLLKDEFAPVIVEVMAKGEVEDFEAFQAKVASCPLEMDGTVLRYTSVYGDEIGFDSGQKSVPTINGQPVDYAPAKLFDSPFLESEWDSGVVTIRKGDREKVLDFNRVAARGSAVSKKVVNPEEATAFEKAAKGEWKQVFADPCTGDWKERWLLDGEVGKVSTGPEGMTLTAGPEFRNDAHHMVLWTRESFEGDIRIEYDYTRLDDENRCVNILYVQATGSGEGPFDKDLFKWNEIRKVPAMKTYFNNLNTYHISYAAFDNSGNATESYIRGRRYMPSKGGLKGTELSPEYVSTELFEPNVPHRIAVIKHERDLFMRIENPDQVFFCRLGNRNLPGITEGRIGLRHMFTRSARYRNFRVSIPVKTQPAR
ncbi:hypothetical protein HAHE_27470 [Haloferula helveola]|uniref:Heparin-sulfate lyase N-terminal domain-containing protein n=1 Tax=Haloferula helveola TaxID=490095 RepID=A0ABM7RGB8_9BACT|nr:hypothetical protein HAHE_27470 [Haloferula helveola]